MRKEMGQYRGQGKGGEWHYGSLVIASQFVKHMPKQHSLTWIVSSAFGNGGWFNIRRHHWVNKETVGQQTPFTDRFGQPIFEGMHVKTRSDDYFHCMDSGLIAMDPDGQWVISKYEDEIHGMPINWDGFDSIEIIKD